MRLMCHNVFGELFCSFACAYNSVIDISILLGIALFNEKKGKDPFSLFCTFERMLQLQKKKISWIPDLCNNFSALMWK